MRRNDSHGQRVMGQTLIYFLYFYLLMCEFLTVQQFTSYNRVGPTSLYKTYLEVLVSQSYLKSTGSLHSSLPLIRNVTSPSISPFPWIIRLRNLKLPLLKMPWVSIFTWVTSLHSTYSVLVLLNLNPLYFRFYLQISSLLLTLSLCLVNQYYVIRKYHKTIQHSTSLWLRRVSSHQDE